MAAWPPRLPDHVLLEPWRPMHAADLAELRERVGLGPCEAIECEALHPESKARQLVTAFRPARQDIPQRPAQPSDLSEAIRRARAATGGT